MIHRKGWLASCVASALCSPLAAQTLGIPEPPFTLAQAQHGKELAAKSDELRAQVKNIRDPADPLKIMGNLYFVGVANGEVYLLTSPKGHILLGAGFKDTAALVEKNIEALGFHLADIKIILINHNHPDEAGATAYFKEKTGAQVMTGFAEVPYLENGGVLPPTAPVPRTDGRAGGAPPPVVPLTPAQQWYPPVKVDRALFDGDVVKLGPLSVTAYLAPGHSASSTSFLFNVREGGKDYRVFEFCCWEYPAELNRNSYINEASVRHTLQTFRKVLPVDIYLEGGVYAWSGILNQPSGTLQERMAKLQTDHRLFANREIFRDWSAWREIEFARTLAALKAAEAAPTAQPTLPGTPLVAAQPPPPSDPAPPYPQDPPNTPRRPATVKGPFTLAVVGDLLSSHPIVQKDDAELAAVGDLLKAGDLVLGNQEGVFFDKESFKGSGYGDGLLLGEAGIAKNEKSLFGIGMVSIANNHSTDWAPEGLLETQRLLDQAHIVHAGGGRTLAEARRPAVVATPKGRIAVVAAASTFKTFAGATDAVGDAPARPGISVLRTRRVHLLSAHDFDGLRTAVPVDPRPQIPAEPRNDREISLGGEVYRASDHAPGLIYEMNQYDHAAILQAVHDAKAQSDFVIFTIHAHETPSGFEDGDPLPPDFLKQLLHEVVDAGADMAVAGGPHTLRGVEWYRRKPVLYGMGGFLFRSDVVLMQDTLQSRAYPNSRPYPQPPTSAHSSGAPAPAPRLDPPAWYDGMIAVATFDGDETKQVKLYPLDLGRTDDPSRRGIPHLASPENAKRILETLRQESQSFGTTIGIDGSIGLLEPQ